MTEIGLGIFEDTEVLKNALEIFEKNKKSVQDHILERTSFVPREEIDSIVKQYKVSEELARAIFVLDFEYKIPRILSASFYQFELDRLIEMQYELPDIYSFRVRFSIEEGFWIKYLIVDFPKKVFLKLNKLIALDRSIFGDQAGEKDDSASYVLERAFICSETIKPVLYSWIKDHQRASFKTAATCFLCGIKQKNKGESEVILNEIAERFYSNIDILETILKGVAPQGWILRAKEEFEKVAIKVKHIRNKQEELDWRISAELILETILLLQYDSVELPEQDFRLKEKIKEKTQIVSVTIDSNKENFVTDKISNVLTMIEDQSKENVKTHISQLIKELYDIATITNREKPAFFAKAFLERINDEYNIEENSARKFIKKFDSQLMFRLSPAGSKEYPGMGLDEKVINLTEEITLEIMQNKEKLRSNKIAEKSSKEKTAATSNTKDENELKIQVATPTLREKLVQSSDKELWLFIRDEYLKTLFNSASELDAGSKLLKKLSIELGLMLTQGESTSILEQELTKKEITMGDSNKEEIDTNICKVIFKQIKDQRSSITK
ncbi:MAG: hypothetical protein ACFFDW_06470 [Candidatus Thorarchaeota archaeon]